VKSVYSVIILIILSSGAAIGYQWRDQQAKLDNIQRERDYQSALIEAAQRAKQREQLLQNQMELLSNEAQQQLDEVITAERAAADSRVRELAKNYAAGGAAAKHSSVADGCQTERKRAAVLAELLAELNDLATVFATEADRNRISGLACEQAYLLISQ